MTYIALLNGKEIARTDSEEKVEGNIYFPKNSVKSEFFKKTNHETTCPWKGKASYYTVTVNGKSFENVAWTYENPKKDAKNIKEHIAFYSNKVDVKEV